MIIHDTVSLQRIAVREVNYLLIEILFDKIQEVHLLRQILDIVQYDDTLQTQILNSHIDDICRKPLLKTENGHQKKSQSS